MTNEDTELPGRSGSALERPVVRPVTERSRTCEQGCNGCDECTDYDYDELLACPRCHGDGMDPWNDYLLPCPECSGRAAP